MYMMLPVAELVQGEGCGRAKYASRIRSTAWTQAPLEQERNAFGVANALDGVLLSSGDVVVADIQTRQCPDDEMYISKGGTGDILGVLALTCTRE